MQISLLLALAALATAPTQPTLEHSAPFLGHTLVIDVDSAPALQTVVLLYSPRAGHTPTPFGLFELERPTSQRVAIGMTDALGQASFSLPIPANASLAENEAHFQALIDDPAAIEGKVFSEGVHVRLLGTRIYTGLKRSEIEIVSPICNRSIARVIFDLSLWENGSAVFSDDYSVGAVMTRRIDGSGPTLLRFDPFFGAVLGRLDFGGASTTLLGDLSGQRAFVLENSGRISAVDLTTGGIVGHLDLPNPVTGLWCSNSRLTEAFVVERVGTEGRPAVRRVDLDTLTDMGSFVVADDDAGQTITSLVFANKTVFVTSEWYQFQPLAARGALTRIDLSQSQPVVTVQWDEGFRPLRSAASASADRLVVIAQSPSDQSAGVPYHHLTSLSQPTPFVNAGPPPFHPTPGMSVATHLVTRDAVAWTLGRDVDDGDAAVLFRLNMGDLSWWWYPRAWIDIQPDLAIARDEFVDELYVSLSRCFSVPQPEILVLEQPSLAERHIPLARDPLTMHTVTVP
jgi:hypothetical protein